VADRLGLAAVVLIALATLPASLAGAQLERVGLAAAGFSGSIWQGARRASPGVACRWATCAGRCDPGHCSPAAPRGHSTSPVPTVRSAPRSVCRSRAKSGSRTCRAVSTLPRSRRSARHAARLARPPLRPARGSRRERRPATVVRGTLDMDGLVAPPPRGTTIGSYLVVMPDPPPRPPPASSLPASTTRKDRSPSTVGSRCRLTAASCSRGCSPRAALRRPGPGPLARAARPRGRVGAPPVERQRHAVAIRRPATRARRRAAGSTGRGRSGSGPSRRSSRAYRSSCGR